MTYSSDDDGLYSWSCSCGDKGKPKDALDKQSAQTAAMVHRLDREEHLVSIFRMTTR